MRSPVATPFAEPSVLPPLDDVARIAVLRANGLGDLVVAEPALAALRAVYPRAHITLIGAAHHVALLAGRPSPVDRVVACPLVPGIRVDDGRLDDPEDVVEAFCAARRADRLDLAVQLHGGGAHANPLLRRWGARVTVGSRAPGALGLDREVTWTPYQHEVLRWLEVVGLAGAAPVRLAPRLEVTAADRAAADAALGGERPGEPLVTIHPGATDPRRRWPPERLAAVADGLAGDGVRVVLLGADRDRSATAAIRHAARAPLEDLTGALDLPGLVGVLARAALFVGVDSGPRHLAEAVGTATAAVFTAANLVDMAPLRRYGHRVLVAWESRCATCGRSFRAPPCDHDATVLGEVPTGDVLAAARDLLGHGAWTAAQAAVG